MIEFSQIEALKAHQLLHRLAYLIAHSKFVAASSMLGEADRFLERFIDDSEKEKEKKD